MQLPRHAHNLFNQFPTIAHIASLLGPPYTHTARAMESWAGLGKEARRAVGLVSCSQTSETTVGYM